jgi:hypothetical protein
MNINSLIEILENHYLWLRGNGGERADLSGANLTRADLTRANLSGADLTRANLSSANLSGANLSGADLTRANLYGADLYGADLTRADLSSANLYGANLTGANLTRANLSGVSGCNCDYLVSLFIDTYPVVYTFDTMQIGCAKHLISEWLDFSDKRILEMDGKKALKFWRKYKEWIFKSIELCPAKSTSKDGSHE